MTSHADSSSRDELVALTVNEKTCLGSGTCEMLEEAVFLLDDDTLVASIVGDGQLPRSRALIVIDRCPASAITVAGDESESTP